MGENKVEIDFSAEYSRDGTGFHRFEDLQDGSQYVYTKFEPTYC
jgi:hypothetical protein